MKPNNSTALGLDVWGIGGNQRAGWVPAGPGKGSVYYNVLFTGAIHSLCRDYLAVIRPIAMTNLPAPRNSHLTVTRSLTSHSRSDPWTAQRRLDADAHPRGDVVPSSCPCGMATDIFMTLEAGAPSWRTFFCGPPRPPKWLAKYFQTGKSQGAAARLETSVDNIPADSIPSCGFE